jgi:tripartite-type tricarboxylate transporter receptor subunit TctC
MIRFVAIAVAGVVGAYTTVHGAVAQVLDGRPIVVVVPFSPGASADSLMRMVTKNISDKSGQTFVIENRPGAGGAVGAAMVKQARPDGLTLLQANAGTHALISALQTNPAYDPVKDFSPITLLWSFPHLLVVPSGSPAKSVDDLIAYARKKPGGLTFGSPGSGSGGHILGEMLKVQTQTPLVHVPFKGAAPAVLDLVAGRIDFLFASYASVVSFVESGQLRVLGLAGREPLKVLPNVPTMAKAGYPEVDMDYWFALVGPAGTPPQTIDKLHAAFAAALTDPDIVKQMANLGVEALTNTPAELAIQIRVDSERLTKAAQAAGITPK